MCSETLKFVFIAIDVVFIILWVDVKVGMGVKAAIPWHKWIKLFFHGATAAIGPGSPLTRLRDYTQLHTRVGMTPLNEWSARLKHLYLTTINTHKWQISMPPSAFEPTLPASERSQTHALDRAASRIGHKLRIVTGNQWSVLWFYRVERNNTYKILGIKKNTKYGFWGKVLVSWFDAVERQNQVTLHCAEPRCFRTQIPYLQIFISVFSTIPKNLLVLFYSALYKTWPCPCVWASNCQNAFGRGEYSYISMYVNDGTKWRYDVNFNSRRLNLEEGAPFCTW
jgi:hypothetical protein